MEWYGFLLILFPHVIVSHAVIIRSAVIEGNRIELAAPKEANSIPREEINGINWSKDSKPNSKMLLVSLSNSTNNRLSIDKSEGSYGGLMIERTERNDSGPYTCQVIQDVNTWMETYNLDVYFMDPPYLAGPFINKNKNTTFYCDWDNINPDKKPSAKWIYDGKELDTSRNGYKLKEGKAKSRLVIVNPSQKMVGRYACRITVDTNKGAMTKESNSVDLKSSMCMHLPNLTYCKPLPIQPSLNEKHKILDVHHVVIAAIALIIGSLLAFLISFCIYKRHVRKIHLFYHNQMSPSSPFHFPLPEAYAEINDATNRERNTNLPTFTYMGNTMYRDFPN